ncbi:MAG: site-specific integrase [Spirochaetia bacterium]|nr:site-specific integrase [Spirochaetia bacterium]
MQMVQPIRETRKIEAMKKILRAGGKRNELLFILGINSALRVSDLLGLKVADVLDEKGKFKDAVSLNESKTGKSKLFPLNDSAKKAIKEYIDETKPEYDAPLFPSRKGGKAISRVQAWEILSNAAEEVGLEHVGTHTLRKTFGYHVYKRTNNLGLVQKLLNHRSSSETLRYIGIEQAEMDDAYLKLNL